MSVVVALMIGELETMPALNGITRAIVRRAVDEWRSAPGSVLICESAPMTAEAIAQGADPARVVTALPQERGHTTRLLGAWLARSIHANQPALLVTHSLHVRRSLRVFEKLGLRVTAAGVDAPFDPGDMDWKLRSPAAFRAYNAAAWVYCVGRGWV